MDRSVSRVGLVLGANIPGGRTDCSLRCVIVEETVEVPVCNLQRAFKAGYWGMWDPALGIFSLVCWCLEVKARRSDGYGKDAGQVV